MAGRPPGETLPTEAPAGDTRANDRMTASTLCFMAWLAASDCDYGLKLDTDALVIGDFRPGIERAFAGGRAGVLGACDRNRPGGAPRDLRGWRRRLLMYCLPVQVRLAGGRPRLVAALSGPRARQRRFLAAAARDARRHGYRLGEHCLGGAYAVSAAAARALATAGMLEDPLITAGTGLGEDVVLGLLVRAAGFDLTSLVERGDPFAVTHEGLPATPAKLVSDGHAIVHSVKSTDPARERSVRADFAALRGNRAPPAAHPRPEAPVDSGPSVYHGRGVARPRRPSSLMLDGGPLPLGTGTGTSTRPCVSGWSRPSISSWLECPLLLKAPCRGRCRAAAATSTVTPRTEQPSDL